MKSINIMNVTELARKLKIPTRELLDILPAVGFDIGRRAIKIDNHQAQRIVDQWPQLLAQYREKTKVAKPEEELVATIQEKKVIKIPNLIRVKDFATKLGISLSKVMAELMKNGVLSSMNEFIDFDTAAVVGTDLGFEVVVDENFETETQEQKEALQKLEDELTSKDAKNLSYRPPVVVVMGHVDHGKTKLLDAIRKTNIVATESGGITQHIGAYQAVRNGKLVTFIDTPGHEAFTTMRSRGARVADIAILVIAADDSIQPQTKESIRIINSAKLPMIVAINKIDKPEANPEKVKQDLAAINLLPEEWGGKTICVPISAKNNIGIEDLLEMVLLLAETEKESLQANPSRLAIGTVIESHIDKGEGPVATLLVQKGTLHMGDMITVGGNFYGKVRAMKDFKGDNVSAAPPAMPVKVIGLKAAPSVGDVFEIKTEVDRKGLKIKKQVLQDQATAYTKPMEISKEKKERVRSLNLVIRADVLGSLEAIISSLSKLDNNEVAVNIIAKGLGNINEGDIARAEAGQALVLGFHVNLVPQAQIAAKEKKVEVMMFDVIYSLLDEVRRRLEKMLFPEVIRTDLGRLKVLAVFYKEKDSMVVGGQVTKGKLAAGCKVNVLRDKTKVTMGTIEQLQLNKIHVNEAILGSECGVRYKGKPLIEVGDVLEAYLEEVRIKKLTSQ